MCCTVVTMRRNNHKEQDSDVHYDQLHRNMGMLNTLQLAAHAPSLQESQAVKAENDLPRGAVLAILLQSREGGLVDGSSVTPLGALH